MTLHLLAPTLIGALYLAILFILCFGAVTGAKLLQRYLAARKKPAPPPPAQKAEQPPPPEPKTVYYLVERKRTAKRTEYKQPKKIDFK